MNSSFGRADKESADATEDLIPTIKKQMNLKKILEVIAFANCACKLFIFFKCHILHVERKESTITSYGRSC